MTVVAPVVRLTSSGASTLARYHAFWASVVMRRRTDSRECDIRSSTTTIAATAIIAFAPRSNPFRRTRHTPTTAMLEAIVISPARVNVTITASAIAARTAPAAAAWKNVSASIARSSSASASAKRISRYMDAIVGYWNGPAARTCSPTTAMPGRNAVRAPSTNGTPRNSVTASAATTTPTTADTMKTVRSLATVVMPLMVTRYTPKATPRRPAMCSALVRSAEAAAAATDTATRNPIHDPVSEASGVIDIRDVNPWGQVRSEEHTSELQSLAYLVC